ECYGVTVRGALCHLACAKRATGAAAVVDHELLADRVRHPIGDDACHNGGAAAGRERHNQRDGPGRIVLRGRDGGEPGHDGSSHQREAATSCSCTGKAWYAGCHRGLLGCGLAATLAALEGKCDSRLSGRLVHRELIRSRATSSSVDQFGRYH